MSDKVYYMRVLMACCLTAAALPSCSPANNAGIEDLAKSISERGASVAFNDDIVLVSYGQTLPTGMPEDVKLYASTGKKGPSHSMSGLSEILSKRSAGQIEVFSIRDAESVRAILRNISYREVSRSNESTIFRFDQQIDSAEAKNN